MRPQYRNMHVYNGSIDINELADHITIATNWETVHMLKTLFVYVLTVTVLGYSTIFVVTNKFVILCYTMRNIDDVNSLIYTQRYTIGSKHLIYS